MKNLTRTLVLLVALFALRTVSWAQPFCNQAQGTAGFPSNIPCQTSICAADPFCCNTQWDGLCAGAAATNPACAGCLSGGGPAVYCNQPQGTAGFPSNVPCQTAICGADPFCCNTQWDALCASAAATNPSCTGCLAPGANNDNCGSAIGVICGQSISGTTVGAAPTPGFVSCDGGAGPPQTGKWYSIAGNGGQYTASLCTGTTYDSRLTIYRGSCAGLICVGGNDDFCGLQSQITFNTLAATTYYVFVHGFGAGTGPFTLTMSCVAACAPVVTNDVCGTASPIAINAGACVSVANGNTNCAAADLPTPTGACFFSIFNNFPDQWYTFTTNAVTSSLAMTITYGTATNLGYGLYTGACGGLTQVGCSTSTPSGSTVSLTVAPSTTYFLQVLGLFANRGSYTLCLRQPVPICTTYINPANAATVGGNPVGLSWTAAQFATGYDVYVDQNNPPTTLVSSNQLGTTYNYTPTNPTAGQVYYWSIVPRNLSGPASDAPCSVRSFTLGAPPCPVLTTPTNGTVVIATGGTTLNWSASLGATQYNVYLDNSPVPTTLVSPAQAGLSYPTGSLNPLQIYYWTITAIGPYGTSTSCVANNFNTNAPLCVASPIAPANGGSACSGAGTTLSWAAVAGASGYDVFLQTGAPPAGTQVATNQAGTTYNAGVLANGAYTWRVVPRNSNGAATGCADWTFNVITSPPGDIAASALPITSLPFTSTGNDNLASNCWTESNGIGGRDKYWSITTSPCTTTLTVGLCGTGDSRLVIIAADGTTVLLNIDDAPPPGCPNGLNSYVANFPVTANTLYYIVMDGFTGGSDVTATTLTVSANCFCTAPNASVSAINDNCGANTFTLDVLTNTTGSTATANIVYTVNGGGPITVAGVNPGSTTTIPTVGGFATSATIVVSVATTDGQCSVALGDYASGCPINITCGNTTTVNYCYKNNDPRSWVFHSLTALTTLTIDFIQGHMAPGDVINAYSGTDATGTPIGTLTGSFPDLTGASGTSLGQDIFLQVISDGSNSCFDGGQTVPWEFEVKCTNVNCTNAEGSAVVDPNCSTISVEVLDPGNAGSTTLQYTVVGGTPQQWPVPLTGGETVVIGPFTPGQSVQVSLLHPTESGCNENLGTFVIPAQPNPISVFVSATPSTICPGGNSQLNVIAGNTTAYTLMPTTFGLRTGTTLGSFPGDDQVSGVINLPFAFSYFGTSYNTVRLCNNGFLALGGTINSQYSDVIPSANTPDNIIAGVKADLNVANGGTLTWFVDGAAPNRVWVAHWNNVPFWPNTGLTRFQIMLFEADSHIEVHVAQNTGSASLKALGMENQTGTVGYSPAGRNNVDWSVLASAPEAWAFRPSGGGPYTYTWTPATYLNNPNISSPLATNVASTQAYQVSFTASGCPRVGNVTVTVASPITNGAVTPPNAQVCTGATTVFTATPANGVPPFTYAWTNPNNVAAGTAQTVTAGINGTWSVVITDACGGTITRTATLTVNPVPTGTAANNGPVCAGQPLSLSGGSDIGTQFSWTGPGGFTSTLEDPSLGAATSAMAGVYTLTTSTAFCNSLPATTTVVVNATPPPVVVTPAAPSVCAGTPVALTASLGAPIPPFAGGGITINAVGIANPYPSNLVVSGLGGGVFLRSVSINGYSHTFPSDVDVLLQSPSGSNVVIMSDAGSGTDVVNVNYVFRDDAASLMNATVNPSGTYRCTNVTTPEAWVAPGPGSITQATPLLSMFSGSMNGTWKLFIVDDLGGDAGSIANWSLNFEYIPVIYTWAPATGLSSTIGATVTSTVSTDQAYVVTATNPMGNCQNTGNVTVSMDSTDTDNDGVIDCLDNCPTAPGQIGSFCDDGNPNTVLTQLDVNCLCVGGQACTTSLTLEMRTDNNPGQITWQLRDETNGVLVQSGPSMFGPGQPYPVPNAIFTETTCLPDGCYYLRVLDSGGDGIAGGGYILRTAGSPGQRIIDNQGNFTTGSVSAIANNQGFCLPLGSGKLIYTSCDKLDWTTGEYIVASADPGVSAQWSAAVNGPNEATSGYEFWIYNPNGGYTFRKFRSHTISDGFAPDNASRACHLKINNWGVATQIPANVLMNVKVRTRITGVNGNWGPACRFKIDPVRAACPLTKLMDIPGNPQFSCNVTRAYGNNNYVYARPVSGANKYQFRFRIDGESFITIRTSNNYICQLNWVTSPLQDGKTYQVEVRASKNNGATWCIDAPTPAFCGFVSPCFVLWGDVCNLTIDNTPANGGNENFSPEAGAALQMYPNPNRGDQVYLSLDAVEEGVGTVSVDILDMFGKRVSARTIAVQDGFINTVLDLDRDMANGMYMVHITAGEQRYTERLVIQK